MVKEKINNKSETFKIVWQNGDLTAHLKTVKGRRIVVAGIPCFIFKETEEELWGSFEGWNVTHLETGMRCKNGLTKKEAIAKATIALNRYPKAIENARKQVKKLGIKLPVNL